MGISKRSTAKVKAPRGGKALRPATASPMSAEALRAWRDERGLSRQALADLLGLHVNTIVRMEEGERREAGGRPVEITKLHRLALAALTSSILDYNGKRFTVMPDPNEPKEDER
jgi:transcriptional regulator with XRE-family HTH domain